jgi:hypothetical protein
MSRTRTSFHRSSAPVRADGLDYKSEYVPPGVRRQTVGIKQVNNWLGRLDSNQG